MSTPLHELDRLFETELYLYFYEEDLDEERTAQECSFVESCCDLTPSAKILDLACGHGRHSNFFAEKGYEVCGIDINTKFIEMAKMDAIKREVTVEYLEQDIMDINYEEDFDMVLFLFNSLGFFDRRDAKQLLQKMTKSLKIGGRIFLDTKNRDHLIAELRPSIVIEKEGNLMIERLSFDPIAGTTTNKRIYIKDGKRYDAPFTMTAYNYNQLERLVEETGLKIGKTYGGWKGEALGQNSRRIIVVLEKE